jgi:hypothetical protein
VSNEIEIVVKAKDETAGAMQSAQSHAGKLKDSLGGVKSVAAGMLVGGAITSGFEALHGFFSDAIEGGRESNAVSAQTAAVLKSTGGAAKITADQVGDLSTAISNKTGVDDEAIQSSENMLLTFTDVRNEVGKGNDIFNQATQTVTDMSVALGQSGKASAIQLGKALNDPIKGVTALSKVGVTFTAQQKEQIKTLVEHGHKMEAQKLILHELGREFGGSAQAQATGAKKAAVAFGNLQEQVGQALIPVIDKLASIFAEKVVPALSSAVDWLTKHQGVAIAAAGVIGGLLVAAFIAWAVSAAAAAAATLAATWPIIAIIVAIAALAAGILYAYTHFETFHNIVNAVAHAIAGAAKAAWNFELTLIQAVAKAVAFVIDRFGDMADFVGGVLSHIPGMGAAGRALQGLGAKAHAAAQKVRDVANAMDGIKSKTVTIRIQTVNAQQMMNIDRAANIKGRMAHGGIIGRAAGGGPRSNVTLVGEDGPELVDLAPGSTVHSAPDTDRMLGAGGAARVVLEIRSGGSAMDDLLVQVLRKSIRVKGGNVQTVLGT